MAFSNIDPTTPAGNEKKKFGDDRIREFKQQTIDNLTEISNYPASTKPALKTAVWTTATRPSGTELVDRITGYNTDLGYEEYYDLATTTWKPKLDAIALGANGAAKQISSTDLNTVKKIGFYYCFTPTNSPAGKNGYLLVETYDSNNYVKQTFSNYDGSGQYTRYDIGGTWSAWANMANASTLGGYTPLQLILGYDNGHSFLANGYQKFSGGLIIQWCRGALAGNEDAFSTNFPIPFPNACLFVNISTYNADNPANLCKRVFQIRDYNTTIVTYYLASIGTNVGNAIPLIFAIGY